MLKKGAVSNVQRVERRIHWRDRRDGSDRRNPGRLNLTRYDCRTGQPRRASDIGGELADGDVWWNNPVIRYE